MASKLVHRNDVPEGRRVCKELGGRTVVIFRHKGQFHCLDANCYHMGGPVGAEGDIEDLGDRVTIRCPWHGHKICVSTGGIMERDLGGNINCSETKHRVHNVFTDVDGWLWVQLMQSFPKLPSDDYNQQSAPRQSYQQAPPPPQQGFGLLGGVGLQAAAATANGPTFGSAFGSISLASYGGADKLFPMVRPRVPLMEEDGDAAMFDADMEETLSQEAQRQAVHHQHHEPQGTVELHQRQLTPSQLPFRSAKSSAGGVAGKNTVTRNQAARQALAKRRIQAPIATESSAAPAAGGVRQSTIKDFFGQAAADAQMMER